MPRTLWVDRTFDFSLAADAYPELIDRLRAMPARVEQVVAGLARDTLTRRDGDRWSIQEHTGHLSDLDAGLFLPRLDDYESGAAVLRAADMTNRFTHDANHNARPIAEVLERVRASRGSIVARLEALPARAFARRSVHPRLQRSVRLVDLLQFQAEHDDHHIENMRELRAQWGCPPP